MGHQSVDCIAAHAGTAPGQRDGRSAGGFGRPGTDLLRHSADEGPTGARTQPPSRPPPPRARAARPTPGRRPRLLRPRVAEAHRWPVGFRRHADGHLVEPMGLLATSLGIRPLAGPFILAAAAFASGAVVVLTALRRRRYISETTATAWPRPVWSSPSTSPRCTCRRHSRAGPPTGSDAARLSRPRASPSWLPTGRRYRHRHRHRTLRPVDSRRWHSSLHRPRPRSRGGAPVGTASAAMGGRPVTPPDRGERDGHPLPVASETGPAPEVLDLLGLVCVQVLLRLRTYSSQQDHRHGRRRTHQPHGLRHRHARLVRHHRRRRARRPR